MSESIVERNILTIIEPTIELDALTILDRESNSDNSNGLAMEVRPSKFSSIVPYVIVNGYEVDFTKLRYFEVKNEDFYPTIKLIFADRDNMFTSRFYPKDGDIIKINIRSQGDETTFKPIRIDFTIIECKPINGNAGGGRLVANEYLLTGRMFIPNLFTENVSYEENVTSWDALLNIAEKLKLGYASNVEETADQMTWTNPNDTNETWIQNIVSNSYLNDESFFTSYIDPYYYLTMVDVNRLFSQEGAIEISQDFMRGSADTFTEDIVSEETTMPNILTNLVQMQGNSRYMSSFQLTNNTGKISKANGYKRYTQYWDLEAKEWVSEFVDPFTNDTPGMIPATKGRILNGETEGPRNEQVKYKYLGTQGDNVHSEFQYSTVLNYQNNTEINKMGMTVELQTVNPGIVRYSRIYCLVLEYNDDAKTALLQPSLGEIEGDIEPQTRQSEEFLNNEEASFILNEYLTGFYVVTGVTYFYSNGTGVNSEQLKMRLKLQRREFTPTT